mmetsp:Transcript_8704/g.9933  ORF Transcript_8704/g.9933 Transcript_8704/m.9933 type:complete len:143 (-) Transcript_8704:372-800(-)
MGISSGCLNFKNSFFNGQKGNIKCTTTKIKDQNVTFSVFFVKTVSNSSCSRFVNNTKYIQSSNNSCILGSLSLRVVEISWNSYNCILNFSSKKSFSDGLHLSQNHGTNFLSSESLFFILVLHLDHWLISLSGDDLERKVLDV